MGDPHWRKNGRFRNINGAEVARFRDVLKWRFSRRAVAELPEAQEIPALPVLPRNDWLASPAPLQITWLGHATWLIQMDGVCLITDPTFGRLAYGTVARLAPAPIAADALPIVDAILVSHNHYDHCDSPSLRALRRESPEATVYTAEGLDVWMRKRLRDPVEALPWWEGAQHGGVRVSAVPAQHWSIRGPHDRLKSHWCGFVIEGPSGTVYFAGDTAEGPHFQAIADRFSIDVALMPIGAYSPRWFMSPQHIGPEAAVAATSIMNAHLLAMHWGTYRLTEEPLDEPPRLLSRCSREAGQPFTVLRPGGTWRPNAIYGQWVPE